MIVVVIMVHGIYFCRKGRRRNGGDDVQEARVYATTIRDVSEQLSAMNSSNAIWPTRP
jgi:hypothetical protein